MYDGARLSGATLLRFAHNDLVHCRDLLQEHRARFERCLIVTETVFSMDGDRGPVEGLRGLARDWDAWVLTDDAHGLGTCPPIAVDVQMGTLSKAAASYGGYVCGSSELIAWLEHRARSLLFSTGLPPATVAAATAAVRIIRDDRVLRQKPRANARRFTTALGRPPAESPIVPVIVGQPERALAASAMLERHGLLVVAIRPPSVPPGTARLRFTFSALHEPEPIDRATALLIEQGYA
jgi:8-amino-7-oxononanoate synthase